MRWQVHRLFSFFTSKDIHEGECYHNATLRKLSTISDIELVRLRDSAREFAQMCENTYNERYVEK